MEDHIKGALVQEHARHSVCATHIERVKCHAGELYQALRVAAREIIQDMKFCALRGHASAEGCAHEACATSDEDATFRQGLEERGCGL